MTDRWDRWVYGVLVVARFVVGIGSLGMIHPDEFFQSQEVMARHVLDSNVPIQTQLFLPWEYQPPHPNRSVFFPALIAGLPYKALGFLGVPITGELLLYVPRILLCLLSFVMDRLLFLMAVQLKLPDPFGLVLAFASSWPTLLFLSRPFSNTLETLLFTCALAVLVLCDPHWRVLQKALHVQTWTLGSLLAVGCFTRFTFIFFFLPIALELVRRQDALFLQSQKKKQCSISGFQRLQKTARVGFEGFMAFAFGSAVLVGVDTMYFRTHALVVAPWNNLLYNLQYENIAIHGIHPRITHGCVNMPMLFGPAFLVLLYDVATKRLRSQWTQLWLRATVLVPLALISVSPHQEPRFLLPLLVPLHLAVGGRRVFRLGRVVWMAFNATLLLFFGLLHQGGVVPALLAMQASTTPSSTTRLGCSFTSEAASLPWQAAQLVFYKTYMPPRFLLAGLAAQESFQVIDLSGSFNATQLDLEIERVAHHNEGPVVIWLPGSIVQDLQPQLVKWQWTRMAGCFPHLSTEDLPTTFTYETLSLQAHQLTKNHN